jgi:hypothetical protein
LASEFLLFLADDKTSAGVRVAATETTIKSSATAAEKNAGKAKARAGIDGVVLHQN